MTMANPQLSDILQMNTICRFGLEGASNVMHYRVDAYTGLGATLQELAIALFDDFQPEYVPFMTAAATFSHVEMRKIAPLPVSDVAYSTQAAVAGSIAVTVNPLPPQVCGIITKRTGLGGRKFRGRIYLPFFTENANDVGLTPNAATLALMDTLAAEFAVGGTVVGAAGTTGFNPVIWHKATQSYTYVTRCAARPYWTTQRSRINGRF